MENKELKNKVSETYNVLNLIEEVTISPFFKGRVLQKIKREEKNNNVVLNWFTPKIQLATMCLIAMINFCAVFYAFNHSEVSANNTSDIESFAQEYSLINSDSNSILN